MPLQLIYKTFARPALFNMDAELAHNLMHGLLPRLKPVLSSLSSELVYKGEDLRVNLFGHELANPLGLAAGFDKNADLVDCLPLLGFSFAELGSITARPTCGNPKPRLFRLPDDQALINRLGLNGQGAEAVALKLAGKKLALPCGINIAKTNDATIVGEAAVADVVFSFNCIKNLPISYVTINASCPNTHEAQLAQSAELTQIIDEINKINSAKLPILIKLSPDSSDALLYEIVGLAADKGLAGFVCGNTTTQRPGLVTSAETIQSIGAGGLSGKPLKALALSLVERVNRLKHKQQIIIGVGGISCGQDAYQFLQAGASLVQAYTGLVYRGPTFAHDLCTELSQIQRN